MQATLELPRRTAQTPDLNNEGLASMASLAQTHGRSEATFANPERPIHQQFANLHENWATSDPLRYGHKLEALAKGEIPDEFHDPLADYLVTAREQNLPNKGFTIFPWLAKAARGRIATRLNNDLIKTGRVTLTLERDSVTQASQEALGRVGTRHIITDQKPEPNRPVNRGMGVQRHRTGPGRHRRSLGLFSRRTPGKHAADRLQRL